MPVNATLRDSEGENIREQPQCKLMSRQGKGHSVNSVVANVKHAAQQLNRVAR